MELSPIYLVLVSGLAATLVMTMVMYLYASLSRKNTKVVHILGSMLTGFRMFTLNSKTKVLITGAIAHVFIGQLFSFIYFIMWSCGLFDITLCNSLIIGAVSGIVAIFFWKAYFMVYQNPIQVPLLHYFIALFISHIVFGIIAIYMFSSITISTANVSPAFFDTAL
ncbi:hypothetical protein [Psychroflexus montanilacus]|uniref:hypothetical protein n=1 Tax=Psychroflexus montanilacus TaxID=2873598 RepID=UPI001CCF3206|nr:hypothetical protein [Psychroflexus montanilacus]MBZ9650922.1 hypothetical protein [Psychroflexus montanilacus]